MASQSTHSLTLIIDSAGLTQRESHEQRFYEIAQVAYQGWLASQRIDDPKARVVHNASLGIIGLVGKERAEELKIVYDILPYPLVIEINRAARGYPPLDTKFARFVHQ